ncbi:MAG TPA: efflux RND transporter permease subunit, partial [Opitutales bacterium]|nr:efflux RND transporter permease subunit [Opitutales bacterium]
MLKALVQFSLRFRGIVVLLAVIIMAYGLYDASQAKLDVFPDFVPPEVTIQAECPGLSAEQVEALVTRPLENQLNGLGHEKTLRSESIQGLSVITIVFDEGTPILPARQLLAEKMMETAGLLPAGVKAPTMSPLTSPTMDLLKIGLLSDKLTPMQLRTFATWTLRPRLLSVPGVADCKIFGGEVREWQVQVHPDLLVAHNVSLDDVLNAARLATGVVGAGFVENDNQRLVIQTEAPATTAAALGNVVVTTSTNGVPVRLADVATVAEGAEPKFGDALIQGKPGVLLTMTNQYGSNTEEVTRGLEQALAEMKPVFAREGITLFAGLHRPATFIEFSLANIRHSLILGAVLVAVVLFLFLGHVRTALISLTAIPLSLLAAILVMNRTGINLNTITLGGLAIAIGAVVDDAIIDVENILRRLRENQTLAQPRPMMDVVLDASLEVRSAVVYATFVVALVFAPVLSLSGLSGSFFSPLALSYILAVMASLVVALTVTPAMTYLFFARHVDMAEAPWVQRKLRGIYTRILERVAKHPGLVLTAALLLCLAALAPLPFLVGGELLPDFREGHFVIGVTTAPGTSLPEMMRIGGEISQGILKIPQVATIEQQAGRAERGEDTWGPDQCEFHVELKHPPDYGPLTAADEEKALDGINNVLKEIPGINYEVKTFLGDRIGETIGGETQPVIINIFGDDLDTLDQKANEIAAVLTKLGSDDAAVSAPPGLPLINVKLRGDRLTELGFRPLEVLQAVQSAYEGTVVTQVYEGGQVSDVSVILDAASRRNPTEVGGLLLRSPSGLLVPLREVAEVELDSGRHSILHNGARRLQTVTCSPPAGRDVGSFVAEAQKAIAAQVTLPQGVYLEYAGEAQAAAAARNELLLHGGIALAGIFMLLYIVLGNWRNLSLVLVNLPFALMGGVFAAFATCALIPPSEAQGFLPGLYAVVDKIQTLLHIGGSGSLSMGSWVGFVTLFGITTRNTIMLLSHYEHLVTGEGQPWNLATVIRGAAERLNPILMTALVTALGLLPLALGSGEAGREIEGPMAIVILGGLITSTALNLLVMPTLAAIWFKPVK